MYRVLPAAQEDTVNVIINLVSGTATVVTTAEDQAKLAKAAREASGVADLAAQRRE
jgi:hypothetical protein